jgi:hypothetical protein
MNLTDSPTVIEVVGPVLLLVLGAVLVVVGYAVYCAWRQARDQHDFHGAYPGECYLCHLNRQARRPLEHVCDEWRGR